MFTRFKRHTKPNKTEYINYLSASYPYKLPFIPVELWHIILALSAYPEVKNLSLVSKSFRKLVLSSLFRRVVIPSNMGQGQRDELVDFLQHSTIPTFVKDLYLGWGPVQYSVRRSKLYAFFHPSKNESSVPLVSVVEAISPLLPRFSSIDTVTVTGYWQTWSTYSFYSQHRSLKKLTFAPADDIATQFPEVDDIFETSLKTLSLSMWRVMDWMWLYTRACRASLDSLESLSISYASYIYLHEHLLRHTPFKCLVDVSITLDDYHDHGQATRHFASLLQLLPITVTSIEVHGLTLRDPIDPLPPTCVPKLSQLEAPIQIAIALLPHKSISRLFLLFHDIPDRVFFEAITQSPGTITHLRIWVQLSSLESLSYSIPKIMELELTIMEDIWSSPFPPWMTLLPANPQLLQKLTLILEMSGLTLNHPLYRYPDAGYLQDWLVSDKIPPLLQEIQYSRLLDGQLSPSVPDAQLLCIKVGKDEWKVDGWLISSVTNKSEIIDLSVKP